MAKYLVEMPFKAVQFFEVEAESASQAKRLAAQGEGDDAPVETIDWRVVKHYAPTSAQLIESGKAVGNG